ncbi:Hypothetical predicted protein, partial [Marmota monax]
IENSLECPLLLANECLRCQRGRLRIPGDLLPPPGVSKRAQWEQPAEELPFKKRPAPSRQRAPRELQPPCLVTMSLQ